MRFLLGFARFWYDFLIGDDWRVALGVGGTITLGIVAVSASALGDGWISGAMLVGIVASLVWSLRHAAAATR